jgi:penicillin-binding protein 1C
VRAWVGSIGAGSQAAQVDAVLARRQPGSTLKPFVYGLALDARLVTAASTLDDSPLQLDVGGGQYQPRNYDHSFRGAVPLRQALGGSLNVPAVRVARLLGAEPLFDGLQRAGLRLEQDAGFHGHALALGSADVTLLDLANAYRALAQGGLWRPWQVQPGAVPDVEAARRVLSREAAWLVADMLADPAARAATFGFDSALVTRGWAAVKTGTSKDLRDNWAVGFTRTHTVAVWVGNASGAPMHGVSGTQGAAPVWRALVQHLQGLTPRPAEPPQRPPALVARHGEWFLPGTEPLQPARERVARMGIRRPADGAIVVLDPGIPRAAQRLVFEGGEPSPAGTPAPRWWLNGQPVPGGRSPSWEPRPGRHVLELRGPEGTQRIGFEVRVAPVRAAPPAAAGARPRGA